MGKFFMNWPIPTFQEGKFYERPRALSNKHFCKYCKGKIFTNDYILIHENCENFPLEKARYMLYMK